MLYMRLRARTLLSRYWCGYAIETCNPLRLCGASAANHEVGARNAIESFLIKTSFGGAAWTASHDIGAIYAIENRHFFNEL